MELTPGDLNTGTWDRLRVDMETRLQSLRKRNDADLDPTETAGIRGQIREINYWLSLSASQPPRDEPVGIDL